MSNSENDSESSIELNGITEFEIAKEKPITKFDPECVRKRSNWSTMRNEFKMDHPDFRPDFFLKDMPAFSPKLAALLKKIGELDARDEKKHGRKFKHFIFSDIKSGGQGAKMLAAGLMSSGWTLGYTSVLKNKDKFATNEPEVEPEVEGGAKQIKPQWGPLEFIPKDAAPKGSTFLLLSSVSVYDKPISVRMKKDILSTFNSRPENIYGDLARIIVMDSGFKEGIDLFDIKYVHIFEPSLNAADQKQVIGRGTRTCGQKGLQFDNRRGWPLEVFIYDLEIPEKLRFSLLGAETAQDLLMRAMDADIRLANFGYDVERLAVIGSVDYELNQAVHNFQVDLEEDDEVVFGGDSAIEEPDKDEAPAFSSFGHDDMVEYIRKNFGEFRWKDVKMENLCGERPKEWLEVSIPEVSESKSISFEEPNLSELSDVSEPESKSILFEEPDLSELSDVSEPESKSTKKEKTDLSELSDVSESKTILEKDSEEKTLLESPKEEFSQTVIDSMKLSPLSQATTVSESLESVPLSKVTTVTELKGGASTLLDFTPTQDFIRHYFSPTAPVKGMLLMHSVGTGKTCSAIAAATTNFEPMGYTILWITRTTLKNDIWKNMFDQVCHATIRERIAAGESIPDVQKERMRLLSKAWRIRPMSYKQFSNLVSKKNSFYQQLVKENGEADPLQKTLLIIDEAHKLYGGGDLSSLERPDMGAFHQALMNSYAVSGINSARVLLMTATPITENAMELIQLINLCKPIETQMPATFAQFSAENLTEEGTFTDQGRARFLDDIAGHISYLNREKDARQFSQPRVKKIMVPMVTPSQMNDVEDFDKFVSRSLAEEEALKLQVQLETTAKKIEEELKIVSKLHFQHFNDLCETYPEVPAKKCQVVIKKNITALMREVAGYTKNIREQMKTVRGELTKIQKGKQAQLVAIQRKIRENPTLYTQYQASTYAALRGKCGSKTLSGTRFLDIVRTLPEVEEIDREIQASRDEIRQLENQLVIEVNAAKLKIKQMKNILKQSDIAPLEKTAVEFSIREAQKNFRVTKKALSASIQDKIQDEKTQIKEYETEKKQFFTRVRKTLKRMNKAKKQEETEAKKQAKIIRKLQTELPTEEITDDEVKQMAARRETLIVHDLEDLRQQVKEQQEKQKEKEEIKLKEQNEKQKEKQNAKTLKEREKKEATERARLEKERAKQAAKTLKQRMKELARLEKEQAKTLKVQEKEKQKSDKSKTRKQKKSVQN